MKKPSDSSTKIIAQNETCQTMSIEDIAKDAGEYYPSKDLQISPYYSFPYWGPLLFQTKLPPKDLKECAKICRKKSSPVNETLAGVIKHEHHVSTKKYTDILSPYLISFRHGYSQWYGIPLTKTIKMTMAWVNFMVAGEFNPPHIHPGCDFSSVLFIKIPEELKEEHKKFSGTGGGPGSLSFTYGEPQLHSLFERHFFPEQADLFIFPATLSHFVTPFMSKGERISVSANFQLD